MSSCTFIQFKNGYGETIVINPDFIKMFIAMNDGDATKVFLTDETDFLVDTPFETFKNLLGEANFFVKVLP